MSKARQSKIWSARVCVTMALAASAAQAQDGSETATNRTPANAQKFLAAYPPEIFYSNGRSYPSTGLLQSGDACETSMSGALRVFDSVSSRSADPAPALDPSANVGKLVIRWSSVQSIGGDDGGSEVKYWITIAMPADPQKRTTLGYSTSATRDRVLAAMQYLKDACDKSNGLGF